MKSYKLLIILSSLASSLLITSCNSSSEKDAAPDNEFETEKEAVPDNEFESTVKCSQWDSQIAVENRIKSLGHRQISIQLNSAVDCRYQWLVQFISSYGTSEWCAMTTDGSSGFVEIVNVTCN